PHAARRGGISCGEGPAGAGHGNGREGGSITSVPFVPGLHFRKGRGQEFPSSSDRCIDGHGRPAAVAGEKRVLTWPLSRCARGRGSIVAVLVTEPHSCQHGTQEGRTGRWERISSAHACGCPAPFCGQWRCCCW